jgi:hypothetical protein
MVANPEWKAVRSVHLQGGCRAFNGLNNSVELRPIASNGKTAAIATPTYPALFGILEQAGFLVIGTDFYFGPEQTDGRRLPEWRSYNVVAGSVWPCIDQARLRCRSAMRTSRRIRDAKPWRCSIKNRFLRLRCAYHRMPRSHAPG